MKVGRVAKWIVGLGLAIGLYAVAIEPFRLVITRYDVKVAQWPKNQPPLHIALVADPHVAWPWMTEKRLASIVARTNALRPDVILILGDYVGTHKFMRKIPARRGVAPLEQLQARCGVFAIFGNHDIDPRAPGWPEALRQSKLTMLENQHRKITCKGQSLAIAGLADQIRQQPDLEATLAGTENLPTLLMMHEPDMFPQVPKHVALTTAGHTHGGQVAPPLIGPIFVPSKYGTHYARGVFTEVGRTLVVSSGLGMSILPVRLNVPPEITLVRLQSTD